jgi:hypothetical protein
MLTLVKLNTPDGGKAISWLTRGLNAPSAPVLPLLKAKASHGEKARMAPRAWLRVFMRMVDLLLEIELSLTLYQGA